MRTGSLLLGMMMAASLAGCSDSLCGNEMLDRITSPDGKMVAAVFSRECGATTGSNVQVSIIRQGTVPDDAGNIFIMDSASYSADIKPRWIDNGHLALIIPEYSRVYLKNGSAEGVRISYQDQRSGFESD